MKFKIVFFLLFSVATFAQNRLEVFFDFNVDFPNEKSAQILQKWISDNPTVEIIKISGYCDSIDNSSYNKELSSRRIKSVLKELKKSIAISKTIELEPFGKDFKQSKIQEENRKVVVFYRTKKSEDKLSNQIKFSKKGDVIKLKTLNFYNNSDVMVPKSEPILKELLAIMKDNPKLKIEIQGHVCCKTPEEVETVSLLRAKAVYTYLVRNNIDKNRMIYKGYGSTKPIFRIPEKNSREEDENRRVEILILEN